MKVLVVYPKVYTHTRRRTPPHETGVLPKARPQTKGSVQGKTSQEPRHALEDLFQSHPLLYLEDQTR